MAARALRSWTWPEFSIPHHLIFQFFFHFSSFILSFSYMSRLILGYCLLLCGWDVSVCIILCFMFFFLVFFFSHAGGWPYRLTKCCHFNWRLFIRRFRPGYVVCQIPLSYTVAFALGGCFLSSCDLAILFGVVRRFVPSYARLLVGLYVCMYACMYACMCVC